jgi:hypothetical protein
LLFFRHSSDPFHRPPVLNHLIEGHPAVRPLYRAA